MARFPQSQFSYDWFPRGFCVCVCVSSRHTVLEALRVASVWGHGNTSSAPTPVIPYARLAFAHTLKFLAEVGFVPRFLTLKIHCARKRRDTKAESRVFAAVGRFENIYFTFKY